MMGPGLACRPVLSRNGLAWMYEHREGANMFRTGATSAKGGQTTFDEVRPYQSFWSVRQRGRVLLQ